MVNVPVMVSVPTGRLVVVAVAAYPVTPLIVVGVSAVGVLKVAPGEEKETVPVGAASPFGTGIKKVAVTRVPELVGVGAEVRLSFERGACETVTDVVGAAEP